MLPRCVRCGGVLHVWDCAACDDYIAVDLICESCDAEYDIVANFDPGTMRLRYASDFDFVDGEEDGGDYFYDDECEEEDGDD